MLGKAEGKRIRGWQRMRWLNGITDSMDEFEQTLRDTDWQGSLVGCSPWGRKELDRTYWLNNNNVHNDHQNYVSKRPEGTGQMFFNFLAFPATGLQSSSFRTIGASLSFTWLPNNEIINEPLWGPVGQWWRSWQPGRGKKARKLKFTECLQCVTYSFFNLKKNPFHHMTTETCKM